MKGMKKVFIYAFSLLFLVPTNSSEINPQTFIDSNAQSMVQVIVNNQDLFESDPDLFKKKIKDIFEPMVDFRRVSASVMGKEIYLNSSTEQRSEFIEVFKNSLLDTYASTLAQWGDQKIVTNFTNKTTFEKIEDVNQDLLTESNSYPITYKVRKSGEGWKIINIIVNGVNLGLTFRNQFRALAEEFDGDIDKVILNWTSNANIPE
ncbi:MAG: ABC transporter substrate-binding protein [Gammaproteobacteria bacterium TMED104]|nr:MAG: ABC transporter substrate-binding protein [Gammaproteobacteria bacterium TMED104]|tara:strand:+ start:792 stop:1406 length:615 start_codon:yes stop_codon:yes gene_type:complete